MINLKSYSSYSKKNNIILLILLCILYIVEITISFYNLNDIISSMNNLPESKFLLAKIFVYITYVLSKIISFFVVTLIYYLILNGFLRDYFDNKSLKKEFIYFAIIGNIAKVIISSIILFITVLFFKYNNIDILTDSTLFRNINNISNIISTILCIFIIYKLFNSKAKKQNYEKLPILNFYIPYFIWLFISLTFKFILK